MFFNRRSNIKKDAAELFNNNNFGFNTNFGNPTKPKVKEENENVNNNENNNKWAQWWNIGNEEKNKVTWKVSEKIVLIIEGALVLYFIMWRLGLVPIF